MKKSFFIYMAIMLCLLAYGIFQLKQKKDTTQSDIYPLELFERLSNSSGLRISNSDLEDIIAMGGRVSITNEDVANATLCNVPVDYKKMSRINTITDLTDKSKLIDIDATMPPFEVIRLDVSKEQRKALNENGDQTEEDIIVYSGSIGLMGDATLFEIPMRDLSLHILSLLHAASSSLKTCFLDKANNITLGEIDKL